MGHGPQDAKTVGILCLTKLQIRRVYYHQTRFRASKYTNNVFRGALPRTLLGAYNTDEIEWATRGREGKREGKGRERKG